MVNVSQAIAEEQESLQPQMPPRPEEVPADYPAQLGGVDVFSLAKKDVQEQEGITDEFRTEVLGRKFDGLMALRNNPQLTQQDIDTYISTEMNGISEIGGVPINTTYLQASKDATNEERFFSTFMAENTVSKATGLPLAFSSPGPEYKEVQLPPAFDTLNPKFKSTMTDIVTDSQETARIISNIFTEGKSTSIPLEGQKVLLNTIATGDFYTEFKKTMGDLFPEVARGLPDFPAMVFHGGKAVFEKTFGGITEYFGGEEAPEKSIAEMFSEGMDGYSFSTGRRFYEAVLNSATLFEDAYITMNKMYKDSFYARFNNEEDADKAWFTAHQDYFLKNPELEIVTAEDGSQSLKQVVDENGVPQYQEYQLPQDTVRQLFDLSFNRLPTHEKAVLYFAEMAPVTYAFTVMNMAKQGRYRKVVDKARNETVTDDRGKEVPKYSRDKSDLEVFDAERKKAWGGFQRPFSKAWNLLTLQSAKGMLARSDVFDMHVQTLRRYDSDISEATSDLGDTNIQIKTKKDLNGDSLDQNQLAALGEKRTALENSLKYLQEGKERYKIRMGSSTKIYLDNPFIRELVADDALIAGAMAYGKSLLSGSYDVDGQQATFMSPVAADAITSILTPIFAPMTIRGSVTMGLRLSNKATADIPSTAAETLDFIGSALHIIPPDTIRSGNVADMKTVLQRNGLEPSDEAVKSFTTLNKIFSAMPREYRERAYQGLLRYNRTMQELRTEMQLLDLDSDVIDKNMSLLSLSLAKATGLAPLVAAQGAEISGIKVKDLTNGRKITEALDSMKAEEELIEGMDLNLALFVQSVEAEAGINIASNETLQDAVGTIAGMVVAQRDSMFARKDILRQHVDEMYRFAANPEEGGTIDESTVERLTELSMGLLPEGTVADNVTRARVQLDVRQKLLAGVQDQLDALSSFHGNLKSTEIDKRMNHLTEAIFNITEGTRISEASSGYRQLDNLKDANGNAMLIDASELASTITNKITSLEGQPISKAFKGGNRFMSQGGTELYRTMNKVALRGMVDYGYTVKSLRAFVRQKRKQTGNEEYSFADLALEMQEKALEKGNTVNYLLATPSEVAAIERHFRNVGRAQSKSDYDASVISKEIAAEVSSLLGQYTFVDEAGVTKNLSKAYDQASVTYRKIRGEPTSAGTYAGNVRSNRTYKETLNNSPTGLDAKYKNKNRTPRYIYKEIEELMAKAILPNTDGPEFDDIVLQIKQKKDELLEFIGAEVGPNGELGFDSTRKDHVQVMRLFEEVFNIAGATAFSGKIRSEVERQAVAASPILRLDVKEPQPLYNFSVYDRINKIELAMEVPLVSKTGKSTSNVRLFNAGEVGEFAKDFDQLLIESVGVQTEFKQIRTELLDNVSSVRIGAEKELAIEQDLLARARQLEGLPEDPIKFGKKFFDGRSPEQFEESVIEFVQRSKLTDNPMTEPEVRAFMKYQYMRMLMEKSGVKFKYTTKTADREGIREIQDVNVLIDHVADADGKRAMMEAVLGKRHTDHMDAIADWATFASGNGMGVRGMNAGKLMSLESAFSRAFNIARGMVSPLYVGTEVSTRMLMYRNESLIKMALGDREAAGIMAKILANPSAGISGDDIKTLGLRLRNYIAKDLIVSGGTLPTVDQVLSSVTGNTSPMIEAPKERIQERDPNEQLFKAVAGE